MSDEIQKARAEVWEFAKTISGSLTADQYRDIFQCGGDYEVFDKYTYEGAKELFAAWSQKNIEVGDVCVAEFCNEPFVITAVINTSDRDVFYEVLRSNGIPATIRCHADGLSKTGKKIDVDLFLKSISS